MRKIYIMLFLLLLSFNTYAIPIPDDSLLTIDGLTVVKLNNIEAKSIRFVVFSPGDGSGTCRLIIRSDKSNDAFKKFNERFKFTQGNIGSTRVDVTPMSSRYGLSFKLPKGVFIAETVGIETKNGKSIAENITSLFSIMSGEEHYPIVAVLAGMCSPNQKM